MGKDTATSIDELNSYILYEPDSGEFYWKKSKGSRGLAGSLVGHPKPSGYLEIRFNSQLILGHRLAWLLSYGTDPPGVIDHINQDKLDNRLCNLRSLCHSLNHHNTKMNPTNTSGVKGVVWDKRHKKWIGRLRVFGKMHSKLFLDFKDAVEYRQYLETKYVKGLLTHG